MLRGGFLFLSNSRGARKVLTGTPLTRPMSRRFVPGETVEDLVRAVREANESGLKATGNYLGEAVTNPEAARAAADAYVALLERFHEEGLEGNASLKFTQMGQDIDEAVLRENLDRVLEKARETDTFLRFDMESSAYTDRTLDAFQELWDAGWTNTGVVLQAYLKRTADDVRKMIDLGARVRICKGAYAEPPEVAFQEMSRIRRNFIEQMGRLMKDGNYPAIATHDEEIIGAAREFSEKEGIGRERFEFQLLYGVRRDLQKELVDAGYNVRVYVPFGEEWYPYLMRRLAERPENLFFMVGSVVKESPLGGLFSGGRRKE
jgi:proline dehydrogenase